MGQQSINTLVMALTALLLAGEAFYAWRRSRFAGRRFFALFLATNAVGALCAALLFRGSGEAWVLRWAALWEIMGSTLSMALVILFAARFAGVRRLFSRPAAALLIGGSAALVAAVAVDPGLVYLSGHGLTALSFTHESVGAADGPLFWTQDGVYYCLIVATAGLLVFEMRRGLRLHAAQALAAFVGLGIVLGVQVLCMLGLVVLPGIHAGVIAVALGVPPVLWALPGLRAADARVASERHTLEAMSDAVFVLTEGGALASANAAGRELLAAEIAATASALDAERFGWLSSRIAAMPHHVNAVGQEWSSQVIELTLAGEARHYHVRQTALSDRDGSRLSSVLVLRDVSAQVATEAALRGSEDRLRILFEQSPLGILVFNSELIALEVNERWSECTGHESREIIGQKLSYENLSSLLDACRAALSGEPAVYNGPLRTRSGEEHWFECEVAPLRAASGVITGGVCLARNVTENRRSEALIERLSFSDTVTSLPNRGLLRDRLRRVLAEATRSGLRSLVTIVDINGFSAVNEALGHAAGDRLLAMIGERLRLNVRERDTIARWAGDEFAVLAPSLAKSDDALALCERVHNCFATPWLVDGREVWLTASIGAALSPANGREADALLSHAESALRSAKEQGGEGARFYAEALGAGTDARLALAGDLHRALAKEQLEVFYQPQVDMIDGRVVGCEALVRWRHPERGLVGPDQFIPMAETSGLIVPIGAWVLRTACAQVAAWTRVSGRRLCLGVNVSAHQLRQGDLVETVTAALAESGLAAAQLELEVTETAILVDQRAAARTLEKIADLGVMVALDDFGTGYSSLAHLCELPINRLKIDRSFVGQLPEARNAAAVCRAVIDLADDLGITVIAEGVETPEQVAFLCDHGCTAAQGYLYGKPVPAQELGQRLLPAQQPGLRLLPAQELDLSSLPAVGEAGGA